MKFPKAPLHVHRNIIRIVPHVRVVAPECLAPRSPRESHSSAIVEVSVAAEGIVRVAHA